MNASIQDYMQQANNGCKNGNAAEAAAPLRSLLKIVPGSKRVTYTAALMELLSGKAEAADELQAITTRSHYLPVLSLKGFSSPIADIAKSYPENLTLQLVAAEADLADGKVQEAKERFIAIVRAKRSQDYSHLPLDGLTEATVRAMVAGQPIWHSIDLGGKLWIEGLRKTARVSAREILQLDFPDFKGKSVLDIGAFGGFFSFEAERRGATVTALEYYSWVTDYLKMHAWMAAEKAEGRSWNPYELPDHVIDCVNQPGRRAFDVAFFITHSSIRPICGLFEALSVEETGIHDIVLYLGVLYHTMDPFGALRKLRSVTREMAIIETAAMHLPGAQDRPVWEYYRDDRLNKDASTWWAPNELGLREMLLASGFRSVEVKIGPDAIVEQLDRPTPYRLIVHAFV